MPGSRRGAGASSRVAIAAIIWVQVAPVSSTWTHGSRPAPRDGAGTFRSLLGQPLQALQVLHRFGSEEIARIAKDTATFLASLSTSGDDTDWEALAVVLQSATAHFWLMEDLFGTHPAGISRERFIRALVALTARGIGGESEPPE